MILETRGPKVTAVALYIPVVVGIALALLGVWIGAQWLVGAL